MVELIDKRGKVITDKFRDLEIGQCFQDMHNNICMKSGNQALLFYEHGKWKSCCVIDTEQLVIPLKTTITIERCEG